MLDPTTAFSSFAVDDLDKAQEFYGDTLGLDVTKEEMGFLTLRLGDRPTMIYPKPDYTPATYTVLHFPVDDVEKTVDELAGRGVTFERYDGFDQDEKGIARMDEMPPGAWFTDPAGNIIGMIEDPEGVMS
jgi:catechol 2,3-dioxygenase-like lactoylglutathione lyase family enzyme